MLCCCFCLNSVGCFNPALTMAIFIAGCGADDDFRLLNWRLALCLIGAQMLAGLIGAVLARVRTIVWYCLSVIISSWAKSSFFRVYEDSTDEPLLYLGLNCDIPFKLMTRLDAGVLQSIAYFTRFLRGSLKASFLKRCLILWLLGYRLMLQKLVRQHASEVKI